MQYHERLFNGHEIHHDSAPQESRWRMSTTSVQAIVLLALFLVQFPFWCFVVAHNHARAEFARETVGARVLGADIRKYRDYFRGFPKSADPTNVAGDRSENVFQQYHKRPLYALIFLAANHLMSPFEPSSTARIIVFSAICASLAGTLLAWLLMSVGWHPAPSVAASLLGVFSYAWLSMFSIPESYSLTVSAMIITLVSGQRFLTRKARLESLAVGHGIIVGVAAWLYPPLCGAALLAISGDRKFGAYVKIAAIAASVAVLVAVLPQLVHHLVSSVPGGITKQLRYGEGYLKPSDLLSVGIWRDAIAIVVYLGIVSPVRDFVLSVGRPEWSFIGRSLPTLLGMAAMSIIYLSVVLGWTSTDWRRLRGLIAWAMAAVIFAVVYNGREMLLQAPVLVTILIYALALLTVRHYPAVGSVCRRCTLALLAGALLLLWINFSAIFGSAS